jgi:hypothetical protein
MGCRAAGISALTIRDTRDPAFDVLKWKWARGEATTLDAFRDPVGGTATYRVCVYDGSAAAQPLVEIAADAGGTCGRSPCWRARSTGFVYRNASGTSDGIVRLTLASGVAGRASVFAKAKGIRFATPRLPLALPVTVQLVVDDGATTACWQSTYTRVTRDDATWLDAKAP